jgi:hypothetical protein|tara:strand:- start:22 stop:252 length:231 start_codon:yes stop_codon:yes gene_type:complete
MNDYSKQLQYNRLLKLIHKEEYHGWLVNDPWIKNKIYKNKITNSYHEISYITKDANNPLPFHKYIKYVGIVHEYCD